MCLSRNKSPPNANLSDCMSDRMSVYLSGRLFDCRSFCLSADSFCFFYPTHSRRDLQTIHLRPRNLYFRNVIGLKYTVDKFLLLLLPLRPFPPHAHRKPAFSPLSSPQILITSHMKKKEKKKQGEKDN